MTPVGGDLLSGGEVKLGDELGDVPLGGGEGDAELLGDLSIRVAVRDEVEDLMFTLRPLVAVSCRRFSHGGSVAAGVDGVPSLW